MTWKSIFLFLVPPFTFYFLPAVNESTLLCRAPRPHWFSSAVNQQWREWAKINPFSFKMYVLCILFQWQENPPIEQVGTRSIIVTATIPDHVINKLLDLFCGVSLRKVWILWLEKPQNALTRDWWDNMLSAVKARMLVRMETKPTPEFSGGNKDAIGNYTRGYVCYFW